MIDMMMIMMIWMMDIMHQQHIKIINNLVVTVTIIKVIIKHVDQHREVVAMAAVVVLDLRRSQHTRNQGTLGNTRRQRERELQVAVEEERQVIIDHPQSIEEVWMRDEGYRKERARTVNQPAEGTEVVVTEEELVEVVEDSDQEVGQMELVRDSMSIKQSMQGTIAL